MASVKAYNTRTEFEGRAEMWLGLRHREKGKAPALGTGAFLKKRRRTELDSISHMIKQAEKLVNNVLITCPHCGYTFSLPFKKCSGSPS